MADQPLKYLIWTTPVLEHSSWGVQHILLSRMWCVCMCVCVWLQADADMTASLFLFSTCLQRCTSLYWCPCLRGQYAQVSVHLIYMYPIKLIMWVLGLFEKCARTLCWSSDRCKVMQTGRHFLQADRGSAVVSVLVWQQGSSISRKILSFLGLWLESI